MSERRCKLIAVWNGRVVFASPGDTEWFMSAADSPSDFNPDDDEPDEPTIVRKPE